MEKSAEYYLSKGFDPQHAVYFANGRKQIMKVIPEKYFTLLLTFDNTEARGLDMRSLLQAGTVFAPFRDWHNLSRVYLDENHCVSWDIDPNINSSLVWSHKIDLCPDSCYIDSVAVDT